MTNESGFHPVGFRVLVLPDAVDEKTAGGIIIARDTKGREDMAQVKGTVVEVGPCCWDNQSTSNWAKAGDRIVFGKYSGLAYKGKDGKDYRIINDTDVVGLEDA
jgi:chaperonin GroES